MRELCRTDGAWAGLSRFASLPAGASTTWHLTTPFKELWVIT